MREIKFRGRKICKNEWVYGYYIEDGLNNHYIVEMKDNKDKDYYYGKTYRYVEVIPETIEQFTGLYDKNNIPIYEGDIVSSPFRNVINRVKTYIISYYKFGFMLQEYDLETKQYGDYECFIGDLLGKLEVIGNIYDNKEDI